MRKRSWIVSAIVALLCIGLGFWAGFSSHERIMFWRWERAQQAKIEKFVGKKAPDVVTRTLDGTEWQLADQCGKVVVMDFWATWCGPCVSAMPEMKKLYEKYKSCEDFVMVGVSLDTEKEKLVKFCKENDIGWPQMFEADRMWDNSVGRAFEVRAIPSVWVIDKEGIVAGMDLRDGEKIGRAVEKSLNKGQETEIEIRVESARKLAKLRNLLLLYANDNEDKYPDSLKDLRLYQGKDQDFKWLLENVEYLGRGKTTAVQPDVPIAYDKTLLLKTVGTNVLRNDSSIKFTTTEELEKLGIGAGVESPTRPEAAIREAGVKSEKSKKFFLMVVDSGGQPVTGSQVYKHFSMVDGQRRSGLSTSDTEGKVILDKEDIFKYEWEGNKVLLYALSGSKLAGFLGVSRGDTGREIEWRLERGCRVYGQLKSSSLEKLNQALEWTNVYLYRGKYRPLSCSSKSGQFEFEFLVPPGDYELYAYGTSTYSVRREIEIKAEQQELETNFDLPADRLATLIGKPAPEFREIKGWIIKGWTGRIKSWWGIKLSKLRGKVVLLDFWGHWCGPCLQAIPELMKLHDKYSEHGLVIVGIHDDSVGSIGKLKEKLKDIRKERWGGRDIPFAVALDGGGRTEIEGTDKTASGATTAAYGIQAWPTMVLIDKEGRVVGRFEPLEPDDIERLESMLKAEADTTK